MAHIDLKNDLPGIRGLMSYRPETAAPLNLLAEILLRSDNSLSRGDRELIGAYVSWLNNCNFCQMVHSGMAQYYLQCDSDFIQSVKADYDSTSLSPKMKSLLAIAAAVQKGGKSVTEEHIKTARQNEATDMEIHDTVLIAAAFCMFNRYVDGLGTKVPDNPSYFVERAAYTAAQGYADFS
ncbi:carboxymuconolactone decarboxylase family protein [Pollutibacter soli]|uniref:carboxymuconolactone decarboxylase family protein n=1 Tax=Pollutibacter soli TaxID=3034157 RepID=UPI003013CAF0